MSEHCRDDVVLLRADLSRLDKHLGDLILGEITDAWLVTYRQIKTVRARLLVAEGGGQLPLS